MPHALPGLALVLVALSRAALGASEDVVVPDGQLPGDVRPTSYRLVLTVDPARDRFQGKARIDVELDRSRTVLWLHGRGLAMRSATIALPGAPPVRARWEEVDPSGVAELRPDTSVGPGRATLRFAWSAPVDPRLRGVFAVDVGGTRSLFTQFEPILARQAFPAFDEPRFKTPFALTLVVPRDAIAVANAPVAEEHADPTGRRRVRFEPTAPLPTYLLAFAVGPLSLADGPLLGPNGVRTRPVPFRGVAAHGRAAKLEWALGQTPPLFAALEDWFGLAYPYAKLDVIAVPDLAWGGMENAGAITFREAVVMIDPATAPEGQRRRFANVMAHQWFADLVTMAWWDDVWLNEAFATWIASHVVDRVHPEYRDGLSLRESVYRAMNVDSLASARRIRQPIASTHDIVNAFDDITYQKGAGVLGMFEHWLGPDTFRAGVRNYLAQHRFGSATATDLLQALSRAPGRDVSGPFRSFLDQPGVPLLEARLVCDGSAARLDLHQSRSLPVGSEAEQTGPWQVPICVRAGTRGGAGDACTLIADRAGTVPLPGGGCPAWVMPNADGAGYYRWTLPPEDLARLFDVGWAGLGPGERMSVADSVGAGFAAATLPAATVLDSLPRLARDPTRQVAVAPMPLLQFVREYMTDGSERSQVEAFARALYAPVWRMLGWSPRPREDGERKLLRAAVVDFLARQGNDVALRREAAARGRRLLGAPGDGSLELGSVDPELVEVLLAMAVQEGGPSVFDALVADLHASEDDFTRGRILTALGAARDPALASRARALALDPAVHIGETMRILRVQAAQPETREDTWTWMQGSFDALVAHLPERASGETPWLASGFCDAAHADAVETFFAPRIDTLPGGPRNLAGALESIQLCAARVAAQRDSARAFLARR